MVGKICIMKKIIKNISIFCFIFIFNVNIFAQFKNINDTIIISYFSGDGIFGGGDEAFIFINNNDYVTGKYVAYKANSNKITLNKDSIFNFYLRNRNKYNIIIEWELNKREISFLETLISDFQNFSIKNGNCINPEYYVLFSNFGLKEICLDKTCTWKKYLSMYDNFLSNKRILSYKNMSSNINCNIDGLLINGINFSEIGFKTYHIKRVLGIYMNEKNRKKYSYYKKEPYYSGFKLRCTTIINDTTFIFPDKYKEILINYETENIDTIYTLNRSEAIRKYGWLKGKNGALIIKTK